MSAERLIGILVSKGLTLSTAESCTGGMIGSMITAVPGASECYLGGAVTYSNALKESVLGVAHGTLEAHGAVSPDTAAEMAAGALRAFGSDVSVAVTGVAGPGGGTPEKPVGLVYIAVAYGGTVEALEKRFEGSREQIRAATADEAIGMLVAALGA